MYFSKWVSRGGYSFGGGTMLSVREIGAVGSIAEGAMFMCGRVW